MVIVIRAFPFQDIPTIESIRSNWASFQLLPCDGNEYGKVKSFEVTLGDFTNVHVGWMVSPQYAPANPVGDPKLGVGYYGLQRCSRLPRDSARNFVWTSTF